jgi:dihydroxyacetone kinase-like predicted kinase
MAAKTAAEFSAKNVTVIPSRTIPQGLSAMLCLVPDGDIEIVVSDMQAALEDVETGEITTATRTVELDGVKANKGDIIGLLNGKMVVSSHRLDQACLELLNFAHADHFEIITLFYGKDVTVQEALQMQDTVRSAFPEQEVEIHEGCQPHYHFIVSIE